MFGTSGTLLSGISWTCSEIGLRPSGLTRGGGGDACWATTAWDARSANTAAATPANLPMMSGLLREWTGQSTLARNAPGGGQKRRARFRGLGTYFFLPFLAFLRFATCPP